MSMKVSIHPFRPSTYPGLPWGVLHGDGVGVGVGVRVRGPGHLGTFTGNPGVRLSLNYHYFYARTCVRPT